MFAVQAKRHDITTIEGISSGETMHPVQQAFQKHHGLQCGFCTPAMVLTVLELLQREHDLDDRRVREELSGNLCRCTGYEGIVAAVLDVAKKKMETHSAGDIVADRRESIGD
jgi:carbon-monoxide dehydrogenase small subunit